MNTTQTNQDPNVPTGLDPTAFYLTKAIREAETGKSSSAYTTPGASGEYGAYQYTNDTWSGDSQKFLGRNVNLKDATPEEQNQVAYSKIKALLDSGQTQGQVATTWNHGHPTYEGTGIGKNSMGVEYNIPAY